MFVYLYIISLFLHGAIKPGIYYYMFLPFSFRNYFYYLYCLGFLLSINLTESLVLHNTINFCHFLFMENGAWKLRIQLFCFIGGGTLGKNGLASFLSTQALLSHPWQSCICKTPATKPFFLFYFIPLYEFSSEPAPTNKT